MTYTSTIYTAAATLPGATGSKHGANTAGLVELNISMDYNVLTELPAYRPHRLETNGTI